MKAMAILFRVVFSIIVLLALACYLQVSPSTTLGDFVNSLDANRVADMFGSVNTVTISVFIIILLGVFSFTRILEAAWNVVFCAAVLVLLAYGLYTYGGARIALPHAIYHNEAIINFCQAALAYEVPLAITGLIFIAGWICTSACGRVAITAVVSFGLWYALTEFFTYIVHLWANSPNPAMPETLNMIQGTPWVIAAVPGAFFLIYAILMAFFETFISTQQKKKEPATKTEEKKEEMAKEDKPAAATSGTKEDAAKPAEPAAKSQPILKTTATAPAKKLKLNTPATEKKAEAPKTEKAASTKPEPKSEEPAKVEEVEKAPGEAPKAAEKPAEEPAAESAQ